MVTKFRYNTEDSGRKRRNTGDEDESEDVEGDGEHDMKWSKKLKRPRMQMVADEIESKRPKISAKRRMMKGIQRSIHRPDIHQTECSEERIEIYEEELEDDGKYTTREAEQKIRRRSEPFIAEGGQEKLIMHVKMDNIDRKKVGI